VVEVYVSAVARFSPRKLTDMTDQVKDWDPGTVEVTSWKSRDGAEIEGILHKPGDYDPSKKYPLLVMIRGGPTGILRPTLLASVYAYPVPTFPVKGALVQSNLHWFAHYIRGEEFPKGSPLFGSSEVEGKQERSPNGMHTLARRLSFGNENHLRRAVTERRTIEVSKDIDRPESGAHQKVLHFKAEEVAYRKGLNKPLDSAILVGKRVDQLNIIHLRRPVEYDHTIGQVQPATVGQCHVGRRL